MRDDTIRERQASNLGEFMEHGPGLRHSTRTWVLAKDPVNRRVLVGGLGGFGIGRMWFGEAQYTFYEREETFVDAPVQDSPDEGTIV